MGLGRRQVPPLDGHAAAVDGGDGGEHPAERPGGLRGDGQGSVVLVEPPRLGQDLAQVVRRLEPHVAPRRGGRGDGRAVRLDGGRHPPRLLGHQPLGEGQLDRLLGSEGLAGGCQVAGRGPWVAQLQVDGRPRHPHLAEPAPQARRLGHPPRPAQEPAGGGVVVQLTCGPRPRAAGHDLDLGVAGGPGGVGQHPGGGQAVAGPVGH